MMPYVPHPRLRCERFLLQEADAAVARMQQAEMVFNEVLLPAPFAPIKRHFAFLYAETDVG